MKRFFAFVAAGMLTAIALSLVTAAQRGSAVAHPAPRSNGRNARTVRAVRAVLDAQVAAWNRGDIDGFMQGYWQSPDTVFISGDNLTRGWQTVLERYKKSYDSRGKMGTLTFSELDIKPMGKEMAVATGRWRLVRAADTPHGRFTLILRRTPEGWRIIHDHTSSAA